MVPAATGLACVSHWLQSPFCVVGIGVAASTRVAHLIVARSELTVTLGSAGSTFGWLSRSVSPDAQPAQYSYSSAKPKAACPSSCSATSVQSPPVDVVGNLAACAAPVGVVDDDEAGVPAGHLGVQHPDGDAGVADEQAPDPAVPAE